MSNLKPDEAFSILDPIYFSNTSDKFRQAIIQARAALYMQMPEKVLHDGLCPNCKSVVEYGQRYCPACGKALKL